GAAASTCSRSANDFLSRREAEDEGGGKSARVAAGRPAACVDARRIEALDRRPCVTEHARPLIDHEAADRVRHCGHDVYGKAAVVSLLDRSARRPRARDDLGDCPVRRLFAKDARRHDEPCPPTAPGDLLNETVLRPVVRFDWELIPALVEDLREMPIELGVVDKRS